jgi:hypothetical protein
MTDQSPEKPFAIWHVFHDAPRWWFARGCPPTIWDERAWVRFVRMVVVLGAAGFVVGVSRIATSKMTGWIIQPSLPWDRVVNEGQLGCLFAVLVLLPMSRWLGRPWSSTLLSIPVAGGVFVIAALWTTSLGWKLQSYFHLSGRMHFATLCSLHLSLCCIPLGVWVSQTIRLRSLAITLLGAIACGGAAFVLSFSQMAMRRALQHVERSIGLYVDPELRYLPFNGFQSALLAIAIGLHLVWNCSSRLAGANRESLE